jgi:anti-sigma factor RsiW
MQLSALLDDALSVPEHQALEAHLAACAECRRELEQLRGTVALLGRLPPVHAPAGFVDRVMGEAYRPPWPKRLRDALFRPLRVKLPLEAAAVLLVGVSALYVYQRAPEVQQLARQESPVPRPASPVAPAQPPAPAAAGAAGDASRSKDVGAQAKRAPAEQEAARDKVAQEEPAPASELTAETKPETKPETKKEALAERRPDASGTAPPSGKVETFAQSSEPPASRDAAGTRAAPAPPPAKPVPPAAAPASPPEARGRVGGVGSAATAPPAPEGAASDTLSTAKSRSAARLMRASDASGRLTVPARDPAEAALDALLGRLGATRVARRLEGTQGLLLIDVVVPVARYRELVDGLGKIGRWTTEHEVKTLPPQVRVEVAVTVEP